MLKILIRFNLFYIGLAALIFSVHWAVYKLFQVELPNISLGLFIIPAYLTGCYYAKIYGKVPKKSFAWKFGLFSCLSSMLIFSPITILATDVNLAILNKTYFLIFIGLFLLFAAFYIATAKFFFNFGAEQTLTYKKWKNKNRDQSQGKLSDIETKDKRFKAQMKGIIIGLPCLCIALLISAIIWPGIVDVFGLKPIVDWLAFEWRYDVYRGLSKDSSPQLAYLFFQINVLSMVIIPTLIIFYIGFTTYNRQRYIHLVFNDKKAQEAVKKTWILIGIPLFIIAMAWVIFNFPHGALHRHGTGIAPNIVGLFMYTLLSGGVIYLTSRGILVLVFAYLTRIKKLSPSQ